MILVYLIRLSQNESLVIPHETVRLILSLLEFTIPNQGFEGLTNLLLIIIL